MFEHVAAHHEARRSRLDPLQHRRVVDAAGDVDAFCGLELRMRDFYTAFRMRREDQPVDVRLLHFTKVFRR
jgi:hypothetical protein